MTFRYLGYEDSRTVPNIVVDGSANEATVVTLSHWPGAPTPPALLRDLSAQIAFAYLDEPCDHAPADVVTNNHFDQDGLVSIFALVEPELALAHRDLLIDVAAAGDFATYRDRRAARASMVLSAAAAEEPENCEYGAFTDELYRTWVPRTLDVVLHVDDHRDVWADEDDELTSSEQALADGRITIEERPDVDLAIVRVDDREPIRRGHRFGGEEFDGVHPMAIHNATDRFRILTVHGRRYRFTDRYETWVQFRSRATLPRVDMAPLAAELSALETGSASWTSQPPRALTPIVAHDGESSLDADAVVEALVRHLADRAG